MSSMITLNIKPMSVNIAYNPKVVYKGKGPNKKPIAVLTKSNAYNKYTKQMPLLLPSELQLPPGKLVFLIKWYFATAASDIDNPVKPMQDLICDYYGINDDQIYLAMQQKLTGHKGSERIEFEFLQYSEDMFDLCRDVIINN